jgi:hypothetical protein
MSEILDYELQTKIPGSQGRERLLERTIAWGYLSTTGNLTSSSFWLKNALSCSTSSVANNLNF